MAGTLRVELRMSVLETAGLPVSLHPCRNFGACGRTRTYEVHEGTPDLQSGAFAAQPHMQNKQMKAERNKAANTLRGTLLLKMATSWTLAKDRDRHPVEGSLPSSLAKLVAQTSVCEYRKLNHRLKSVPLRK